MKKFSFDTSAFIEPWRRHYPFDVAESLWKHLDTLGKSEVITAQQEVYEEIQNKDDDLARWMKTRKHFFSQPTEEVQNEVRTILKSHARLLSVTRNRSGADPWVIAQAKVINGAVVTYEVWDPKRKNMKIPEVCHDLGIRCLTFVDFLRECRIRLTVARHRK